MASRLCYLAALAVCVKAFVVIDIVQNEKTNPSTAGSRFACRATQHFGANHQLVADVASEDLLNTDQIGPVIPNNDINTKLSRLCNFGSINEAIKILNSAEQNVASTGKVEIDEMSYATVIQGIVKNQWKNSTSLAEDFLRRMRKLAPTVPHCAPKRYAFNAVIFAWSKTSLGNAGPRCLELLNELWIVYNKTGDIAYMPMKSSYISALSAWSRCRRNREAATRAEELLEEMERLRVNHPHLTPSTICVNAVLMALSKSGGNDAVERCEAILKRMEDLALNGREELLPTTTTFNIVMDALAQHGGRGVERRAEGLLQKMDLLSDTKGRGWPCKPNQVSFNIALNCWAKSRERGAAGRADAILRHMERRYDSNSTDVRPDAATYTTVLNAWARSHDRDAAEKAERVLRRMESAFQEGNLNARPNSMSYNTIINVWAKSKDPNGPNRVLETLDLMRQLSQQRDRTDCRPDVYTYTSVIDCLAKSSAANASQYAENLLAELESKFRESGDLSLQPTVHTYTSVVNAIARSRVEPKRAQAIVDRLTNEHRSGKSRLQPDVVIYNALLNAYGWSSMKGKAEKCFQLFSKMKSMYESGKNRHVKPDIITCNSVLNACAFEIAGTAKERADVMDVVVRTFEAFQLAAPTFGWPNHITFGYILLSIAKHMPVSAKRFEAAEAAFWQACRSGYLGALVVTQLHFALTESWETFEKLMGPALLSKQGELLRFDLSRLPHEWSRHAPSKLKRRESRPSSKRVGPQVTKQLVKSVEDCSLRVGFFVIED